MSSPSKGPVSGRSSGLDQSFRRFLQLGTRLSIQHSWAVILTALVLALAGGYSYFFKLPILTDRDQLLDSELPSNKARRLYRENFGDDRYLILVVNSDPSTGPQSDQRNRMKAIAAEWATRLRQRPDLFPKVTERLDWKSFGPLSVLYLPEEDIFSASRFTQENEERLTEWFSSPSLQNSLRLMNQILLDAAEYGQGRDHPLMLEELERLIRAIRQEIVTGTQSEETADSLSDSPLRKTLDGLKYETMFKLSKGHLDPDGFIFFDDGNILTVFSEVTGDPTRQNRYSEALEYAYQQLAEILPDTPSGIRAGLAGFPALEYEEMTTGLRDISRGTVITLVLVSLLFMLGFRSILRPLTAAVCLALAIGMTCALTWLLVGHLNLLAMVFAIIMLAVGIDFAIHLTTHYEQALAKGQAPSEAIRSTMFSIGGALWLGGITTSAAFFSAFFTSFKGLSELGLIAGMGLIISLICMVVVYPAALLLIDDRFRPQQNYFPRARRKEPTRFGLWTVRGASRGKLFLLGLSILVAACYLTGQYTVDTNLLNLQKEDGKANRWQRLLLETEDVATFAIATFANRTQLEGARSRLESSKLVRRTESLFPFRETEKRALLTPVCGLFSDIRVGSANSTDVYQSRREIWNLRQRIRRFRSRSNQADRFLEGTEEQLKSLYQFLSKAPSNLEGRPFDHLEQELRMLASDNLPFLQSYSCPPEFSVSVVPDFFRHRYLGSDGTLAIFIFPENNVWDRAELEEFVLSTRKIVPEMFGEVVSFYENGTSLIRSFLQSALYSAAAIVVLLLLWSRSLRVTFLAVLPLAFSLGILLVLMEWGPYPVPWNYANFFALPILIGIGVDSGIHLVRAWKSGSRSVFGAAAKAVLLSSLTTIIGFGVLATSEHIGVSSLGYILFAGIFLCLICSLAVLPTALLVINGKDADEQDAT